MAAKAPDGIPPKARAKAIAALQVRGGHRVTTISPPHKHHATAPSTQTGLALGAAAEAGGEGSGFPAGREANTRHALGALIASTPNPSPTHGEEAMHHFEAAVQLEPTNPKYSEAVEQMADGITEYNNAVIKANARRRANRQRKIEEAEEAEAEADEDDFVDTRTY